MSSTEPARIVSFYSFKGGTGRTMALANVAWILAGAGKSVLVVDWDLEAPGLHVYYKQFLTDHALESTRGVLDMVRAFATAANAAGGDDDGPREDLSELHAAYTDLTPYTVQLEGRFPAGGRLDYLGPGIQDEGYADRLTGFRWNDFQLSEEGAAYLDALRAAMRGSGYDYVLIDSRTGLSDCAGVCTLRLPDSVVFCLTMNSQSITGSAQVARRVAQHPDRKIEIHAVPMRIETSEKQRLQIRMNEARQAFREFLRPADEAAEDRYWGGVQIPHWPFYSLGEELAVFQEKPTDAVGVLTHYIKLAERITDGEVADFAPIPENQRRLYDREYQDSRRPRPDTAVILRAPEDEAWADWIGEQLRLIGIRVTERAPGAEDPDTLPDVDSVLVLLSGHLQFSADEAIVTRLVQGAPVSGNRSRRLIGIRVDGSRIRERHQWIDAINLAGLDAAGAAATLLGGFGLSGPVPGAGAGPRFPGRLPHVSNIDLRNSYFTGRAKILAELRDRFDAGIGAPGRTQVLYGMAGVGKSAIALEYAHRFAGEYDVIWSVPASDPANIRASLGRLAHRLTGTELDWDVLRDELRQGRPHPRWLLILDGADDVGDVEPFVPPHGHGHVLVTSRNNAWDHHETQAVEQFVPDESDALLRRRLPGASDPDLRRLAEALGHLPRALNEAAAFLLSGPMTIDRYLEAVEGDRDPLADPTAEDYERTFAAANDLAYARLLAEAPAAAKLLDMCSFLSPDGVWLSVIQSAAMLVALREVDPRLQDAMRLRPVLVTLASRSLASVDQSTQLFKVHRVVQSLRRDRMGAAKREQTRLQVLRVLASLAPNDLECDGLRHREMFAELDKHVVVSGATACTDGDVRRWVVNQVRYRWYRDRWRSALDLGLPVLAAWAEAFPEDASTLRLATQVANAHRSLGRFREAHDLDRATLASQRRAHDRQDPYRLMTARGYAADLRALGRFEDAYTEDNGTYFGFVDAFGMDSADTLSASANLALAWYYKGSVENAIRQDWVTFEHRKRILTDAHPLTWKSYTNLGTYHREKGDLQASFTFLREARDRLEAIEGSDAGMTLRTVQSLGMTLVRAGDAAAAVPLLQDVLVRKERQWTREHPDTMACVLAVAAGLHGLGRDAAAVDYTRDVLDRYVRVFGDEHPFTQVCRANLSLYLLDSGRPDEALEFAEIAASELGRVLRNDHPFTLVARMNRNNALAATDPSAPLSAEDERIHAGCLKWWDRDHPIALTAAANLADSKPATDPDVWEAIRVRAGDALGRNHPLTRTLTARPFVRIGADLEVLDI
jgi:cellulose biosynthesis protein BcsQ/tetratricopeptide (TPR) repeat protein